MSDADTEALYASASGSVPQQDNVDFSAFNLDWTPGKTSSYPNLFPYGGYLTPINIYGEGDQIINDDDMARNNWRWVPYDELDQNDERYHTASPEDNYVVDSAGKIVPKSAIMNWVNSYERQTPYQEQNDNASNEWIRKRMADRLVGGLGITDWTDPRQRNNFFQMLGYTGAGALGVMAGATALPMLLPVSMGGLPAQASLAGGLGMLSDAGIGFGLGWGVDKVSQGITGKNWAQNVNGLLGLDENNIFGEMTNPGYLLTGKTFRGIGNRGRWAAYDNVEPYSYYGHEGELISTIKDTVNPRFSRRIKELKAGAYPKVGFKEDRDAAWRIALGFDQRPDFTYYGRHGDGTLGYYRQADAKTAYPKMVTSDNPNYIRDAKAFAKASTKPVHYTGSDNITSAGGNTGNVMYPNGKVEMRDVWDLVPEEFIPHITDRIPIVNKLPKSWRKKFEVLNWVGGNPFTLKQTGKYNPISNEVTWNQEFPGMVLPVKGKVNRFMPYDPTYFQPLQTFRGPSQDSSE